MIARAEGYSIVMSIATPKLPDDLKSTRLPCPTLRKLVALWTDPTVVFLILGSIFGLAFLTLNPPMQVPDEPLHFYQAYSVAYGNLLSKQNTQIPHSARSMQKNFGYLIGHPDQKTSAAQILEGFKVPLNPDNRGPDPSFGNPFLTYVMGALGIRLGVALDLPPLALMYLGRFFTFLFWLFTSYFAIRLSPILKWTMCALTLTPMSVYEGASLSSDSFTNAWCFLFLAYLLHLSYGKKQSFLGTKEYALLFLLSLPVTFSKFVYCVLILLYWLIPASRFPSKGRRWLVFTGLSAVNIAVFAWWISVKTKFGIPPPFPGVSFSGQLQFIMAEPWNFAGVLMISLGTYAAGYINSFIGILGWLDTVFPQYIYYLYFGIFFLIWIADLYRPRDCRWTDRFWPFSAFIIGVFLVLTSQYLLWTQVGKNLIDGVQGRYFIPLSPLPFLAFALPNRMKGFLERYSTLIIRILPVLLAIGLGLACRGMILRYYMTS